LAILMGTHETEDWPVTGEVPSEDPNWLQGPAQDNFNESAQALSAGLSDDHEVATLINEKPTAVDNLRIKANRAAHNFQVRIVEVGEHKKEVAVATLTVAGLLLAAQQLYIRRKK